MTVNANAFIVAAPQQVDLGIEGWHRGTSLLAQGLVPLTLLASPQFPNQAYGKAFPSVRAGSIPKPAISPIFAAPQYADLSIEGWHRGVPFATDVVGPTGKVPALVRAAPQPDLTQRSAIYQSVRTPPVLLTGKLGNYINAAPQQIDLGIEGWHRGVPFALDIPPPTGKVMSFAVALGQIPWQAPSNVYEPAPGNQGTGLSTEYRWGGHARAIHHAETLKSKVFPSAWSPPPPVPGAYIPQIFGSPQADPSQLKAWFIRSGQPAPLGPTVTPFTVPPQTDPSQLKAAFFPSVAPAPLIFGPTLFKTLFAGPQVLDLTQQAYFQQAIQVGIVIPVVTPEQSTPGRIRHDWWKSKEEVERKRLKEKTKRLADSGIETDALFEEGERLAEVLAESRSKTEAVQKKSIALEALLGEEGVKRPVAERADLERQALIAKQELTILAAQESMLMEEMEMNDILYIARIAMEL